MSSTPVRPLRLRWAARTDVGLVRANNQDAVFAGDRLLAVADGMGGMAAGDVASQRAIEALGPLEETFDGSDIIDALRTAVADANQRIRDEVEADPAKEGMGTTLTAMLFADGRIGMVHIGDSRAYQLRGDEFRQITKDDTYVQMLVDQGRITPEEATTHPQRSLVSRVLQGLPTDPFYSVRRVRPGDRFLLCSDGLSGVLNQQLLGDVLRDVEDVAECATQLVDLALAAGGPDNITAVVAEVVGEQQPSRSVLARLFRRS